MIVDMLIGLTRIVKEFIGIMVGGVIVFSVIDAMQD